MKNIIFTSARVNQCKLEYDLLNSPELTMNNLRWEGDVTIKFTSSGGFGKLTEEEVTKNVLGKLLSSGIFGKTS